MMDCAFCQKKFNSRNELQSHIIDCCQDKQIKCPTCHRTFARNPNLTRHIKLNRCKAKAETCETKQLLEKMAKEIAELKEKPNVTNNQILQVICVGDKDNYLDMLTERLGSFDQALECIKNCALSSLTGDCNLIEKIYFEKNQPGAILPLDKHRNFFEYYNEKKEKVVENHVNFGRKLANNLQKSYLKGINHLINQNLDNRRCPNKFLEEYDLQIWNQHIYDLSDAKYHRKILNNLKYVYPT